MNTMILYLIPTLVTTQITPEMLNTIMKNLGQNGGPNEGPGEGQNGGLNQEAINTLLKNLAQNGGPNGSPGGRTGGANNMLGSQIPFLMSNDYNFAPGTYQNNSPKLQNNASDAIFSYYQNKVSFNAKTNLYNLKFEGKVSAVCGYSTDKSQFHYIILKENKLHANKASLRNNIIRIPKADLTTNVQNEYNFEGDSNLKYNVEVQVFCKKYNDVDLIVKQKDIGKVKFSSFSILGISVSVFIAIVT